MSHRWAFTGLEFFVLWERLRENLLPPPFTIVVNAPSEQEYERELGAIKERIGSIMDAELAQMLQDVARPDVLVLARGLDGRDSENAEGSIRLLGVRRENRGYVLTQLPGETIEHSGGFTVSECHAVDLAAELVAALPRVPPGKQGRVTLPGIDDGMDHFARKSRCRDDLDDARDQGERFLQLAAVTLGRIEIHQGTSRFGPRGRIQRLLFWRDLLDDGRYAIRPANPPVAVSADAAQLTALINTEIAEVVRVIKDERAFEDV